MRTGLGRGVRAFGTVHRVSPWSCVWRLTARDSLPDRSLLLPNSAASPPDLGRGKGEQCKGGRCGEATDDAVCQWLLHVGTGAGRYRDGIKPIDATGAVVWT